MCQLFGTQLKMSRDRVCCVIDAQFFMVNGKSLMRELSIVTHDKILCIQVDTKIKRMNPRDWKTNWFIQKFITGLSFRPVQCYTTQKQARQILRQEYYASIRSGRNLVCIKNPQLGDMLHDMRIPYFCIDQYLAMEAWLCSFHTHERKKSQRCALKKACDMFRELNRLLYADGTTSL